MCNGPDLGVISVDFSAFSVFELLILSNFWEKGGVTRPVLIFLVVMDF